MGKDITAAFGTKRHGLKLGKSFSKDREKRTAFHSIRCKYSKVLNYSALVSCLTFIQDCRRVVHHTV